MFCWIRCFSLGRFGLVVLVSLSSCLISPQPLSLVVFTIVVDSLLAATRNNRDCAPGLLVNPVLCRLFVAIRDNRHCPLFHCSFPFSATEGGGYKYLTENQHLCLELFIQKPKPPRTSGKQFLDYQKSTIRQEEQTWKVQKLYSHTLTTITHTTWC